MQRSLSWGTFGCLAAWLSIACAGDVVLENTRLRVSFDSKTGGVSGVINKMAGQAVMVREEGFRVDAAEFSLTPQNARLQSLKKISPERLEASYAADARTVVCSYTLGRGHHFFEKTLMVRSTSPYGWKNVVVSRMTRPVVSTSSAMQRLSKYE